MNWKYVAVVFVFELIFLAAIVEPTSLATANSASSTAPPIVWEHAYSTGDSSSIRSMIQTTDGDYALAGMGMEIAVGIKYLCQKSIPQAINSGIWLVSITIQQ